MSSFTLIFKYKDGNNQIVSKMLDIGKVTNFSNSYAINNTKEKIPTQPAQNSFVMNLGVKRTLAIDFIRVSPDEPTDSLDADSSQWSNGFWAYIVKRFIVNRWQGETDGCKMRYVSNDEALYPSIGETNVYATEFSPKQTPGITNVLSGAVKVTVGATNLAKVVAKHTVIYRSNFIGQKPSYNGPESNTVKISNTDTSQTIYVPPEWISTAQDEGIISGGNPSRYSYWSTDPDPQSTSSSKRDFVQDSSIVFDVGESMLTLYAIYKTTGD